MKKPKDHTTFVIVYILSIIWVRTLCWFSEHNDPVIYGDYWHHIFPGFIGLILTLKLQHKLVVHKWYLKIYDYIKIHPILIIYAFTIAMVLDELFLFVISPLSVSKEDYFSDIAVYGMIMLSVWCIIMRKVIVRKLMWNINK